ncbi:MAG: peptide ABC transporter substrate-binding protein [Verrucomicrobia bacterium]|nr:peptide ABC transporter substrate-binding protein [Verrucomicrobiota bacterium]
MRRGVSWASYCALGLTLFFSGCAQPEEPADFVIVNGSEPESLDPAIITGQAESRIVRCLFEGLVRLDPKNASPVPGIADKWDILEDGNVYVFHLRSNAVWSTGRPITAEDVVYSWKRVLEPATAADYAGQLYFVKNAEEYNTGKLKDFEQVGVKAVDARTVRVELVGPTPFFLDLCAFTTLAVVPRWTIEKYGDRWLTSENLPSSSTHVLESWRIQDKVRIRKNPLHWDAKNVQNEIVDFLPMDSAMTAMNLYESRQADILWDKTLIPSELMDVLSKREDCHRFDYLGTFFMRFNTTRKPFDDPRVRKALALVIDKKRIVERITRGGERPADHFVPKGMVVYDPPPGLGYDPELARKLLAEAGFPGGKGFPSFQYLSKTGKQDEQIGVEIQAMFKEHLGINMELNQKEWKVYLSAQGKLDFDVSRSSWIGDYNDPNTFLDMFMSNNGNNRTGWKSVKYDDLIREGNLKVDPQEREKILQQAEILLVREETIIAPIYFYAGINFYRPDELTGIYPNLLDEHPIWAIRRVKRGSN